MMIHELISPPFQRLRRYVTHTAKILPFVIPAAFALTMPQAHAVDWNTMPVIGSVISMFSGSTKAPVVTANRASTTPTAITPATTSSTALPKSTATYTIPYPSMGYTYVNNRQQAVYNTFPAQPSVLFNKTTGTTVPVLNSTPMSAEVLAAASGMANVPTQTAQPRNMNSTASNNAKAIVASAAVVGVVALVANNWNYNVTQPTYRQVFPAVTLPTLPSLQGCAPSACPTANNTVATNAASNQNPFVINRNTVVSTPGISQTAATQIASTADVCQGTGCPVTTPVTTRTLEISGNRTAADLTDCQGTGCPGYVDLTNCQGTGCPSYTASGNNGSVTSSNTNSNNTYGNDNTLSTSATGSTGEGSGSTSSMASNSSTTTTSSDTSTSATTADGKYKWPVATNDGGTSNYVSSPFGQRDRSNFSETCHVHPDGNSHCGVDSHNGLDLKTNVGTPIESMSSGNVVWVDPYCKNPDAKLSFNKDPSNAVPKGGCSVSVMNESGEVVSYLHLSDAGKLKAGDTVNAGDAIGKSGNSGSSSGAHLHVAVCDADPAKVEAAVKAKQDPSRCASVGGKPVNPLDRMDDTDPRFDSGKAKEKISTDYLACKAKAEKAKDFQAAASCRKAFQAKNGKVDASRAAGSNMKSGNGGDSSAPSFKNRPHMDGLTLKRL